MCADVADVVCISPHGDESIPINNVRLGARESFDFLDVVVEEYPYDVGAKGALACKGVLMCGCAVG
jgi:hypothetical protein